MEGEKMDSSLLQNKYFPPPLPYRLVIQTGREESTHRDALDFYTSWCYELVGIPRLVLRTGRDTDWYYESVGIGLYYEPVGKTPSLLVVTNHPNLEHTIFENSNGLG